VVEVGARAALEWVLVNGRAVIFDLGGVVLQSPLTVVSEFAAAEDVPLDAVARVFRSSGPDGPWQRLERGELSTAEVIAAFDAAAWDAGTPFSTEDLLRALETGMCPRPMVVGTIRTLRARGFAVAALTNNWDCGPQMRATLEALRPEFDVFIESWRVGMRKPEPGIYSHVLAALDVTAEHAVFLDDFAENVQAARDMGMQVVLVQDIREALVALDRLLSGPDCNNSGADSE